MKQIFMAVSLMLVLLTAGARETLCVSNLADPQSAAYVRQALIASGVADAHVLAFFENVGYFNRAIEGQGLLSGFTHTPMPAYDQEGLQLLWEKKSPGFPGINCRLTAYSLYKDHLQIGRQPADDATFLFMDRESIETNPRPVLTKDEAEGFFRFYAVVKTRDSRDPAEHLRVLQAEWDRRGVRFDESCKARLISIVIHSRFSETENELFVGHTGLLVPDGEGCLFVEKLAFQMPYQAIRFQTKAQLRRYLMRLYDASEGQPNSPPLILENGRLMEN